MHGMAINVYHYSLATSCTYYTLYLQVEAVVQVFSSIVMGFFKIQHGLYNILCTPVHDFDDGLFIKDNSGITRIKLSKAAGVYV
jgi:hypothetical protein